MGDDDKKMGARRVVLSHASKDKADIQKLREALADRDVSAWEDVLELRVGAKLASIQAAIAGADGLVLLLTPAAIGSDWVQREVQWALTTKLERPGFVILPLLRGLDRPALKLLFGEAELVSILLEEAQPIESAVPAIVQALGCAAPDASPRADPSPAVPMAELVIELESPFVREVGGTRRAAARAKVRHAPMSGARGASGTTIDFAAPIGPIEAGDLRWYLEDYGLWPFGVFKERAEKIEANLAVWGRKLFDALLGRSESRAVFDDWRRVVNAERRITVQVDERGGDSEAAAMLFALPWELLADERGYLFDGGRPARVRRMLPSKGDLPAVEPHLPLRVLLVLARPEDERASFLDPRVSAVPLAEALEPLGEAVELTVLADGAFTSLRRELDVAEGAGRPYQVVHFDGHGVYDELRGLGQLCFENADDVAKGKLERRAALIDARDLGGLLRERRVALCVLEACQSAVTEKNPTASVAATLLDAGVASVVAMSHSVLVDTARRFVKAFYGSLAAGDRIGTAMVRAQHALKDDRARGERAETTFELSDWMVPVLFQESEDARLFPGGVDLRPAIVEDRRTKAKVKRGELPAPPRHGFVGRGRALLAIDRLLVGKRVVALVGGGGQGKTALAEEAARWLLAMRRVDRVAFVSVEAIGEARAVLDAIGRQLVPGYAVGIAEGTGSEGEKRRRALLPVEGELQRRRVLIVVDNLESVLPEMGKAVEEGTVELLAMIRALSEMGKTRVLVTSREAPPAPLDECVFRLPVLGVREGMELLAGVLRSKGKEPPRAGDEEEKAAIEDLVNAVGGHARSLVMLGELVAEKGVKAVAGDVRGMMRELEKRYPDERERSLIASVRLSLRRLPEGVREKIRGLAVFQGAALFGAIAQVIQVGLEEVLELCRQLISVGLADTIGPYLLPVPGLGAALLAELTPDEQDAMERRWLQTMLELLGFLHDQKFQDAQISFDGTREMLADLLAALTRLEADVAADRADVAEAIGHVTKMEALISHLGRPRVLERISKVRRAISKRLPTWSHARAISEFEELARRFEAGNVSEAIEAARSLRDSLEAAGDTYTNAAYDRATAWLQLGRMLKHGRYSEEALLVLEVARERFFDISATGDEDAAGMESVATKEKGDVLLLLGRFAEAAAAYEDRIRRASASGDARGIAVGQLQLGTVRLAQERFEEALAAYQEALAKFEILREPLAVASAWHQVGMVHAAGKNFEAAERAYKRSLSLSTAQGAVSSEAKTTHQLGMLYSDQGRLEDAATLYRQAADLKHVLGDRLNEGMSLSDLGIVLHKLEQVDEARAAFLSALAIIKPYGSDADPWKTWLELEDMERNAGRLEAARQAREETLQTYRTYREGGGEPIHGQTRFIANFCQALCEGGPLAACALLDHLVEVPAEFSATFRALQAIAAGNRDPALVSDPAHSPLNAVELALLLESLPPSDTPAPTPVDQPCPCGSGLPFPQCHGAPDPT